MMTEEIGHIRPRNLEAFIVKAFMHHGLSEDHANSVAHTMIVANLRGVDTHGVVRSGSYIERFKLNLVKPQPAFKVETRYGWAHAIDADNGMGPVVSDFAMKKVLDSAESHGIGGATVRQSNHFGAAQVFALQAAAQDCIGIVLSPASKSLAPFGSMEPLFGTNPIAVAAPAGRHAPWCLDMATSISARGHIRIAARRGEPIPEGWALDDQGRPTTDAEAALKGVMLPFAGPKGSALAMLVDMMGGALSGSGYAGTIRDMTRDFETPQDVGHFFMAFKIDAFMPVPEYTARMEHMIATLKALKPAAGFDEVMYPGEREARLAAKREAEGIPIPFETRKVLVQLSEETGIALPEGLN
ncbi:Ldh family oxidoreductase [Alkalilacustris brevis]|uniref:Ldh family oxidoreductase n=1 Tax=Alkalilacustris brevis TaxID=2026338 RepID=UPI00138FA1C4|nr:Ldh family oxidoreductase [Alkalilacustris brevis]